jgi:3-hydroxyacyl-CoA dehydrogenase / enoyl-CoA hydratase / 3-hydroxybutyryl-CoA epimerase
LITGMILSERIAIEGNIATRLGTDGILVATIDMPGRSMNVFSDDLMDSLEALLDAVDARPEIRAVIVRSGKASFLAGADLVMVQRYTESARHDSVEQLHAMCGRLGRLFRRLEANPKPFVAAVDGLALGGGFELALACHARIVSDAPETKLGVPEIKLGLLPGAGGTQRLPRLAGTRAALALLWAGEPVAARRAAEIGLVHEAVPKSDLLSAAARWAESLAQSSTRAPWDGTDWRPPENPYDLSSPGALSHAARDAGISEEQLAHYPAYSAIFESVSGGWSMSMDDACDWEMQCFVGLIKDPVADNMVRSLFLDRQRAAKVLGRGLPNRARRVHADGSVPSLQVAFERTSIDVLAAAPGRDVGITLCTRPGSCTPASLAWLRGSRQAPANFGTSCGIWLTNLTAHGRALEICRVGAAAPDEGALDIARWLQAVPLFTNDVSLFQALEHAMNSCTGFDTDAALLALALAAARVWRAGAIDDTDIADAAMVAGGFAPAYTGGLFTYLRHAGLERVRERCALIPAAAAPLFDVPAGCEALFADERA